MAAPVRGLRFESFGALGDRATTGKKPAAGAEGGPPARAVPASWRFRPRNLHGVVFPRASASAPRGSCRPRARAPAQRSGRPLRGAAPSAMQGRTIGAHPLALTPRQQLTYWGVAALVLVLALWLLGDVLLPFVMGGTIAYFLDPVADWLERRGLSRTLSVVIITAVAALAFAAAVLLLIPTLVAQATALVQEAPTLLRQLEGQITQAFPGLAELEPAIRRSLRGAGELIPRARRRADRRGGGFGARLPGRGRLPC